MVAVEDLWPWPTDTREERRMRTALMYRAALGDADPAACASLDEALKGVGERWMCEVPDPPPEELLTINDAADRLYVSAAAIRKRVQRRQLLPQGLSVDGVHLYRWVDLAG